MRKGNDLKLAQIYLQYSRKHKTNWSKMSTKDFDQRYLQFRRIRNNFADDGFMPMFELQK